MIGTVRSLLRGLMSGPEAKQLRRFVAVGVTAAAIQTILLWQFVERIGLQYLVAAFVAIEITIIFQYIVNNTWTFERTSHGGFAEYFSGIIKTNFVRGSAIPIQLGILYALVDWVGITYIIANILAIGGSGIYRYTLDSRWTWG